MTNIKITDLTAYTDPATTDVLPIVDVGADVTKKVSVGEIVSKITGDVEVDSAGASSIVAGVIVDGDINAAAAIAGTKISPDFGSQAIATTGLISANGKVSFPLGTAAAPSLYPGTDTNTGIYSPGADQVAISTNGTGRLFVDSAGNVGLGTSSPDGPLHISSTNSLGVQIHNPTATTGAQARLYLGARSLLPRQRGVALVGELNADSSHNMQFWVSATAGTGPVEMMRLTNSGRLGIGTTSPSYPLVVASSAASTLQILSGGTTNLSRLFFGDDNDLARGFINYDHSDDSMRLGSNNTERARIDSSGRLLVGTSTTRSNLFAGNAALSAYHLVEGALDNGKRTSAFVYGAGSNSGPILALAAHASNSVGGVTAVTNGWEVGTIDFQAADGTNFVPAARIAALVDGTPGANDMPGRLVFSTTADGASSPTQRMRIDSSGRVGIGSTSPQTTLDVTNTSAGTDPGHISLLNASSTAGTTCSIYFGPNVVGNLRAAAIKGINSAGGGGGNPTDLAFFTNPDGGGPTEKARIDSSGRLLVGTSTAFTTAADLNTAKTQVSGNLAVTGITGAFSEIYGLASTAAQVVDFVLTDGACYMMTLFKHNSPSDAVGNAGTYLLSRSGASVTTATVLAADGITSVAVDGSTYKPEFSPNTSNLRIYHVSLLRLA